MGFLSERSHQCYVRQNKVCQRKRAVFTCLNGGDMFEAVWLAEVTKGLDVGESLGVNAVLIWASRREAFDIALFTVTAFRMMYGEPGRKR